jgi:uncharacterized membrane protein
VAINNDGDVLANAGSVLVWHGGAWNDLGRMGGTDVGANAFNTHGTVVGWMGFYDAASDYTLYQAFVSDNGVLHYFGNPGWTITSEARAVNDAGVVVGKQVTATKPEMHAVVMYPDRAAAIDLDERLVPGTTGWLLTTAEGINDRGQIVGIGKHDGRRVGYLLTPHH